MDSGTDMFFCSHAFGNPFSLVVEALEAHFKAAGATAESVFVWLDIFGTPRKRPLGFSVHTWGWYTDPAPVSYSD